MEQSEFKTKAASKNPDVRNKYMWQKSFAANSALLIVGVLMAVSGLIIQCHYHLLKSPDESIVLALSRAEWNAVHVWTSCGFLFAAIYHVWAHRKWVEYVLTRNLLYKQRPTVLLTFLMLFVSISGLIPLLIRFFDGNPTLRFAIVEIHDKAAILFLVVAIFHTAKRLKWYFNVIRNRF